jgi:oxygen-independent coproporphyrinogen-3 oxidase
MTQTVLSLQQLLQQSPYQTYVYSYPHKTAYRPINPPISLTSAWEQENRHSLFLYIHIPFCEMRCGFCNLFTTVKAGEDLFNQYIQTLKRQAKQVKKALENSSFSRFALGGGTPTQLSVSQLEAVLNIGESIMGVNLKQIAGSVEVSPKTATPEKLKLLRQRGIDRISIGIQSFIDSEVLAVQRKQNSQQVKAVLTQIKTENFPILNIDLMYGLPGQTIQTWLDSLYQALQFQPEEIYLYPLYVRPLTGISDSPKEWDDIRLNCYRQGREFLLTNGYKQISLRMFRHPKSSHTKGPVYCCQADGMIGLGCGARSYTKSLHYSNEYAVKHSEINHILAHYIKTPDQEFEWINYGFQLDIEEQKRRYLLLSLLSNKGLNLNDYFKYFQTLAFIDFPELNELLKLNIAILNQSTLQLTPAGIEHSDSIGSWFFSENVRNLMQTYQLK